MSFALPFVGPFAKTFGPILAKKSKRRRVLGDILTQSGPKRQKADGSVFVTRMPKRSVRRRSTSRKPFRSRFSRKAGGRRRGASSFRSGFKRAGRRGTKRAGFAKRVRSVVLKQLTAPNTYLSTYVDRIVLTGSTNNPAVQAMWGAIQTRSNNVTAGQQNNMQMYDPYLLDSIHSEISAQVPVQFYVKSYECAAEVSNTATSAVNLFEYRVVARRDIPAQALGIDTEIQNGFSDISTGVGSRMTYQTYGATPFMNPRLTHLYKIIKVRKFLLQPGEMKRFRYVNRKVRKFNREDMSYDGGSTFYDQLRGTACSIFVAQGSYAYDSGANANFKQGVSNIGLGIVYKVNIGYSFISDTAISTGTANNTAGFSINVGAAPLPVVANVPQTAIAPAASVLYNATGATAGTATADATDEQTGMI